MGVGLWDCTFHLKTPLQNSAEVHGSMRYSHSYSYRMSFSLELQILQKQLLPMNDSSSRGALDCLVDTLDDRVEDRDLRNR